MDYNCYYDCKFISSTWLRHRGVKYRNSKILESIFLQIEVHIYNTTWSFLIWIGSPTLVVMASSIDHILPHEPWKFAKIIQCWLLDKFCAGSVKLESELIKEGKQKAGNKVNQQVSILYLAYTKRNWKMFLMPTLTIK